MILYRLALVLLVRYLHALCPEVMQPWYADDLALLECHSLNASCLRILTNMGPFFGYYPNPAKSWHVCDKEDEDDAQVAFEAAGLTVQFTRRHWYVGGFIGSNTTHQEWLVPKIQEWIHGVKTLEMVVTRFPQTAYAGMATSLPAEWQFLCFIVLGIAKDLAPVKAAIRSDFLPALFRGTTPITIDDNFCCLLSHGIKMGSIGICNPTKVADHLFAASKEATAILAKNLAANADFLVKAHCAQVQQALAAMHCDQKVEEEAFLT